MWKQFSEGSMTIEYLKDVSLMLAMVSAVTEGCLERHLEAEREIISRCLRLDIIIMHAIYHINTFPLDQWNNKIIQLSKI